MEFNLVREEEGGRFRSGGRGRRNKLLSFGRKREAAGVAMGREEEGDLSGEREVAGGRRTGRLPGCVIAVRLLYLKSCAEQELFLVAEQRGTSVMLPTAGLKAGEHFVSPATLAPLGEQSNNPAVFDGDEESR